MEYGQSDKNFLLFMVFYVNSIQTLLVCNGNSNRLCIKFTRVYEGNNISHILYAYACECDDHFHGIICI